MITKMSPLLAVAVFASMTVSVGAQETTIHSRFNLSVASSANMERIPPKQGLSDLDKQFLRSMAQVNIAEIQLGRLAQRSGSTWGRGFGADMVREHTILLEQLKEVAANASFSLPTDADVASQKAIAHLSLLGGVAFDESYRQLMIDGHRHVIGVVEDEIRDGHNSDIRGYAVTMETAVKLHMKLALQQTTMLGTKNG